MDNTNQNLPVKKIGRPIGAKSTIAYNLGQLYQRFGPNVCPEIGVVWLKQHGVLDANNNFIDVNNLNSTSHSVLPSPVMSSTIKPNIQILDLSSDNDN